VSFEIMISLGSAQSHPQQGKELFGIDRLGQIVPRASSRHFSRSPFMAIAASAMIGKRR
jgi:hypothetical protein